MRDYQLYSLSKEGFENLVYHICKILLGDGTVNFAEGRDGGRDAKFIGKANKFPSMQQPWEGKFIIQAKGGGTSEGLCSNGIFKREIENKEIPRIKKLVNNGEIDNYLIFTSRKLGGDSEFAIVNKIKQETALTNVWLGGREFLTEEITKNPEVIAICDLPRFISPIKIHPQEMKSVIEGFEKCEEEISERIKTFTKREYIKKEDKNKLNNLSKNYFEYIKENSLSSFKKIDEFLGDMKNRDMKKAYLNIADEIQSKITIKRDEFDKFEEIFEEIYDIVLTKCPELNKSQRLVNVFLHHMYWNCKIGRTR